MMIFVPVLHLIAPLLMAALRAMGKQAAVMWVMGASVVIKVALGVLLIPRWGATGAAMAAIIGVAFTSIAAMIVVEKYRPQLIVRTRWLARVLASMFIALGVAVLLQNSPLIVAISCTGVVYLICLRALGVFDRYELELAGKLGRKVAVFRKAS
jgi:O-antigen/teichoic acid export membrane protein